MENFKKVLILFLSDPESFLLIKNWMKKVVETICRITQIFFRANTSADIL